MNLSNKRLAYLFILLFITHVTFSIRYGLEVPWGGDEWDSYNIFTLMALPFSVLVSFLKSILPPINVENYIIYRQQGIFWTALIFIFLYNYSKRSNNQLLSNFAIYLSIFIAFNPYVLQTSQFFRYYQLYIFLSIIITFIILQYNPLYTKKRKWFYMMLFASIFIHLFILIQLFTYVIFKELFLLDKNKKLMCAAVLSILFINIVPNYLNILDWIRRTFFPIYLSTVDTDIPGLRGYSLSTLLKPFMIIFTHMYARNLTPFSYKILDICYVISGLSIVYGIVKLSKYKPDLKEPLFFSGIFPLIFSIYILEPICLTGFPQLVPQHVTFLLPWMAYIFFELWRSYPLGRVINIIFFGGLLYAGYLHQKMEFVDWEKIQEEFKSNNTTIISDNIRDAEFHLKNKEVIWYAKENLVKEKIVQSDTLTILLSNWKIYQDIKPKQFWHNPNGTRREYYNLSEMLLSLRNAGYSLLDGYSFFPYHSYTFVKNKTNPQKIPWLYDLKYRDLKVPLYIENKKIIGFEKIDLMQSVYSDSTFYYFIQTDNSIDSNHTIEITFMDSTKKQYKLAQEDDTFRSNYCRSIAKDRIVNSFKKMPLVSNSMRYPGSMFNSEVRIFKHEEIEEVYTIKCNQPGLTLVRAIVSDR